ncbi:hypothetical protein Trco_002714 [Trichoderma cornu-damae]|uniref:Uncharacterized protein n=1 Tax=Trichoderma cornu-damae TaxID=654480 RepID=A0A9P8TY98_9HYPO|nr:hypothetical protein Trco_002714 [Trichoderma cornu-damae]
MPRQPKAVQPSQRRLPFSELQTDIPDQGYEEGFSLLYSEINQFLKDGIGKKAASPKRSLWTQKHSKEFLSFASMVARPGADEEWEKLLRSRPYRCALLSGVIMMVLDRHVFSDLLFGAGPEHAEVLRMEDSSMVNIEGFRRTGLRADTNRVYLEATGGVPPLFWRRVDRITAQVLALLSPLYAALGEERPSPSAYQALHDIVALAGWLNVAIRLSPKITVLEWVRPGEAYRHSHLCIGEEKTTAPARRRKTKDARSRTRVMISAAPRITRYARGGKGLFSGTATYAVMQPHVVTYTGHYADWEDNRVTPLRNHVRRRLLLFPVRVLSLLLSLVRLAAMLCLAAFFGLVVFGAWASIPGAHRDFGGYGFRYSSSWMVRMAVLPIRMSFRCAMWWFGLILRHGEVRTALSFVSIGRS